MMKYGYGIAALIAFGGATRLNAVSNDDQPVPYEVEVDGTGKHPEGNGLAQEVEYVKSERWDEPMTLYFSNKSQQEVELFWHDYNGIEVSYGTIAAGGEKAMSTYATHPWSAVGESGMITVDTDAIFVPEADDIGRTIFIDDDRTEYRSENSGWGLAFQFHNASDQMIELFWLNYEGQKVSYGHIGAGQTVDMGTYATHPWMATGCVPDHCTIDGQDVFIPEPADSKRVIEIGETPAKSIDSSEPVQLQFFNGAGEDVHLFWHDYSGYKQYYGMIASGETMNMHTYATHPWSVAARNAHYTINGNAIFTPTEADDGKTIYIDN